MRVWVWVCEGWEGCWDVDAVGAMPCSRFRQREEKEERVSILARCVAGSALVRAGIERVFVEWVELYAPEDRERHALVWFVDRLSRVCEAITA